MQREAHRIRTAELEQKRKLAKLIFARQEHPAGSAMDRSYFNKESNNKWRYLISQSKVKMIFVARFWKGLNGKKIIPNN